MARKRGQPIHGWVNLDKPKGISSAKAVAIVRGVLMPQRRVMAARLIRWQAGFFPLLLARLLKPYLLRGVLLKLHQE